MRTELFNELKNELTNQNVDSMRYGKGTITEVLDLTNIMQEADVLVEIKFVGQTMRFAFYRATSRQIINYELSERLKEIKTELDTIHTNAQIEHENEIKAEYERIEKEKEQAKLNHKIAKRLERAEQLKATNIQKVSELSEHTIAINKDYFECLGYITKHIKSIKAEMPDYLENWFVGIFGDVDRRVIDSNKLTTAGDPMKWSLSLRLDLDTNENAPISISQYFSKSKKEIKAITNTQFIFDLLSLRGFKIGKSQNIDEIKELVPEEYRDVFSSGLAA